MATDEEIQKHAMELNIKGVILSLVISAFGFVAALFWRDAIQALINEIVPQGQGLTYQFAAAIIVTVIAVLSIYILSKYIMGLSVRKIVQDYRRKNYKNDKKKKG